MEETVKSKKEKDEKKGEFSSIEKEIAEKDVKIEKANEKVEQINDINVILDIIGGIRFAIAEQSIRTSDYTNDHVLLLSQYGEILLEMTTEVPFCYTVYNDQPNDEVYVLNKSLYKADFSDCDTFVLNRLECRERIINDARKILKEPTTKVIGSNLVYEPKSVGIDYDNLFAIRMDENEMNAVAGFCRKGKIVGRFVNVRVIGDKRVTQLRSNFVDYSQTVMNRIFDSVKDYAQICSDYRAEAVTVLKELTAWQIPMPLCDPFICAGVFDVFLKAPQLRFEYIVSIFSPDLKLSPATYANLMRSASVTMTRASFVNDFVQQSYQASWSESISLYVSSWLSIGDLILDYDDSEVNSVDQAIKSVITSLIFLASVTYDANGVYSNTNISSVRKACKRISDWAYLKNMITRPVSNGDDNGYLTPLSNSTVIAKNVKMTNLDIQRIGGMNGVAGASVDAALPYHDDDPLRRFFPGISRRRNVAMDQDDYVFFDENESTVSWPLQDSINAFLRSHPDLIPFTNIVGIFLNRLRSFYVRMNEFMKIAHYSIFRRSEKSRQGFDGECRNALVVPIKAMIFPYMARSWPIEQRFPQKYDNIERMKMQAGFNASIIETSLRLQLINLSYYKMGILTEISTSKRLELACEKFPHMKQLYEMLKSVRNEKKLVELLDEAVFSENDFSLLFDGIDMLETNALVRDGVLPSFQLHYILNRINRNLIIEAITEKRYIDNFRDFDEQQIHRVTYDDISKAFVGRYFQTLLFSSNVEYYDFEILVPYQISFDLPNAIGKVLISGTQIEGVDLTLRKCLRVSPITISLVFLDGRKFSTPDSYVSAPYALEYAFPPTRYKNGIIVSRSVFVAQLYERAVLERCIIGSNFSFASVLSREQTN